MDKNNEGVVGEEQQPNAAAEAAEADAAFAAGVAKTAGAAAHEGTVKTDEADAKKAEADAAAKATVDAEAKAKADEVAKAEADKKAADDAAAKLAAEPWRGEFDKLNTSVTSQLRNLAGHIGSFKQALEKITTTATAAAEKKGVDAPTTVEIAEALNDTDKWNQLQEDFPEWMKPVAAELTRLRKEMAAVAKSAGAKVAPVAAAPAAAAQVIDTDAIIAGAEERAYVRMKHPDWKTICASPAFAKKDASGKVVGGWLATAPDDIKAKAESANGDDAVVVFDAYKAHQKKLADEEAAKERNKKRLVTAVVVNGTTEPPKQGLDDEAAFSAGVKKTLGGKG